MVVSTTLFDQSHQTDTDGLFQGGDFWAKQPAHIRFSNHNYCGITTSTFSQCLQDIEHLDIDVQGFAETNLNTNQIPVWNTAACVSQRPDSQQSRAYHEAKPPFGTRTPFLEISNVDLEDP